MAKVVAHQTSRESLYERLERILSRTQVRSLPCRSVGTRRDEKDGSALLTTRGEPFALQGPRDVMVEVSHDLRIYASWKIHRILQGLETPSPGDTPYMIWVDDKPSYNACRARQRSSSYPGTAGWIMGRHNLRGIGYGNQPKLIRADELHFDYTVTVNNGIPLMPPISPLSTTPRLRPYSYMPLQNPDSMRILQILPGKADDPLLCILQECRVGSIPYAALSYAWGKLDLSHRMQEIRSGTDIHVTANLYSALLLLRDRQQMYPLWIDGICIDQSNVRERSHQVNIMAELYRKASGVVVWLGREPCNRVVQCFEFIATNLADKRSSPTRIHSGGLITGTEEIEAAITLDTIQKDIANHIRACNAEYLGDFFGRPWFTRVWVVQEFLLGKNIHFVIGERSMTLQMFEQGMDALRKYEDELKIQNISQKEGVWDHYMRGFIAARELLSGRSAISPPERRTSRSLYQCCRMLLDRGCADDRDKVYAALGLAKDDLGMVPDYNLSLDEICIDLAKRSIQSGDFSVLHHADRSWLDESPTSQPSFAPRLNPDNYLEMPGPLGGFDSRIYSAGLLRKSFVCLYPENLTIGVQGVRVDTICYVQSFANLIGDLTVGRGMPFKPQLHETYQHLESIYNDILGRAGNIPSRFASFKLAFWRTIHLGLFKRHKEAQFVANTDLRFLNLTDRTDITNSLTNRVFFITEQGFVGLGPPRMEEKDVVVIFHGAETPFVLRLDAIEAEVEKWKVVGDCYLEGWMDGKYFGLHVQENNSYIACGSPNRKGAGNNSVGDVVLKSETFTLC